MFERHRELIDTLEPLRIRGRLTAVTGLSMLAEGLCVPVGSMCRVHTRGHGSLPAQVVGFRESMAVMMPLSDVRGAAAGDGVDAVANRQHIGVGPGLIGRVLDGLGRPIDGRPAPHARGFYELHRASPPPLSRPLIRQPLGTGVRAMDAVLTVGTGQRLGIFAGTGVGKSVLLGMVARDTAADVIVVALVGERGREVRDFLDRDLGAEGLARSVVVVSTSDESPVLRVRSCFMATSIAEYFRDQGARVLLLLDSLTRLAMAQREIGLAAGEPPATRGYTPSVFALLPRLLERAGSTERGSITGFYAVLVEGDDLSEPVSDAVRGILDGHVWLSRSLAGRGHFPAIDVLSSLSRLMVDVADAEHQAAARRVRGVLGTWQEIEDLVNIGAYTAGSNPRFDLAVETKPRIDRFLQQGRDEAVSLDEARAQLLQLAGEIEQAEKRLSAGNRR